MTEELDRQIKLEELRTRKKIEFEQKIASLDTEIDTWKTRSKEKGIYEKHHTQIRAVQAQMEGWNARVREKLDEYNTETEADVFLSKCANAERLILSGHRIWDYFRSKFIQRSETSFNCYLQAADEFAWECYRPVQQIVYPHPSDAKRKEPPLIFFNGGASPFSLSHDRAFQPEVVAGETLSIDPKSIVNKLPIPVVGVPWQQISHLPEALVIGHEVGHIVEDDFGLTERLKELLSAAITEARADARKDAWESWLGEIFADLYGCLAGGAAFAGTLIDFLAKDDRRISTEVKTSADWGRYPTDYLRVKIVLKALEVIGFKAEASGYETLWKNHESKMPAEYPADIERIVPALLKGTHPKLGGKSVMEVFCFSAEQQKKVNETVDKFLTTPAGTNIKHFPTDIRVLFAALRTAFEKKPDEYKTKNYGDKVLAHIKDNVVIMGVRSGEIKVEGELLKNKLNALREAGADLIDE